MKKTEGKGVGFPNYFKKIGVILFVLVIIVMLIIKGIHYNFNTTQKGNIKIVGMSLLNIGLCCIAFAKEKIDDEMMVHLKLKSIYGALIFGIVYTLISPLIDIAFNDAVQLISAQQLVTLMLFSHIGTYFFLKRNENK
jgi:CDP-diglyceride synthetase